MDVQSSTTIKCIPDREVQVDIENGVSLKQFLRQKLPQVSNIIEDILEYLSVINQVHVVGEVDLERAVPASFSPRTNYGCFIQDLIQWLYSNKQPNVLTNGYKDSDSGFNNTFGSFQENYIQSKGFHQVYEFIGPKLFFNLVVYGHGFVLADTGFTQVFGPFHATWLFSNRVRYGKHLPCLHYWSSVTVRDNLELFRGMTLEKLTCRIFELRSAKIPRSLRPFRRIAGKILVNDKKLAYGSIVQHFSVVDSAKEGNFSYAYSQANLVKCIIVVIDKLIPKETWGCCENRANVLTKIREIIELNQPHVYVNGNELNLKISFKSWFGKSHTTTSKQDFHSRNAILTSLVTWILNFALPLIIRSLWHVTEVSHSNELLYFPQHLWSTITSSWIQSYIDTNLVAVAKSALQAPTRKKFVYGYFRLLPKISDFRLICIPMKLADIPGKNCTRTTTSKPSMEYQMHYSNYVNPILKVLDFKSSMHFNHRRCRSLTDVARHIRRYAITTTASSSSYHFVKFDMKQCYDRLDQQKILQCVERIFDCDNTCKNYYVRQYTQLSKKLKVRKVYFNVYEDLTSMALESSSTNTSFHKCPTIDRCKTYKISKEDIMDVVSSQVLESICYIPHLDSYYRRKQGIFQGFPLLATLCDIVYCTMMEDKFAFALSDPQTTMLRIADDFLLITTCPNIYHTCLEVINGLALTEYGALTNLEKTVTIKPNSHVTELQFVGLAINTKTLQIKVDCGAPISLKGLHNFTVAAKILRARFKSGLSGFYLDQTLMSSESVIHYLGALLDSIIQPLIKESSQFKTSLTADRLLEFIFELLHETLQSLEVINQGCFHMVEEVVDLFIKAIYPLKSSVNISPLVTLLNSL